ncbi:MAG TPA: energy transducer TonB [Candidatus Angelobacter sp.]|nr:energy transducer TonB [Candidatus Angelobacter sp.]
MATAQQSDSQAQQTQSARKTKVNPPPDYPELARKLNIQGIARVLAKVAPDGGVVNVKELGGNPVLVSALAEAVKRWKYEPAEHESEVEIKFDFVLNH